MWVFVATILQPQSVLVAKCVVWLTSNYKLLVHYGTQESFSIACGGCYNRRLG